MNFTQELLNRIPEQSLVDLAYDLAANLDFVLRKLSDDYADIDGVFDGLDHVIVTIKTID